MTSFKTLSAECRKTREANRILDGHIFRTLHGVEDDVWSDMIGDDGVWHRRDHEDHAAWEGPPEYTGSIDVALSARAAGMRLSALRELLKPDARPADWQPCSCIIETPTWVHNGQGETLPLALMDAILLAHAYLHGEK